MNPETFAEWHRRQGRRVVRTSSSWWYEASPRVYQSFPLHAIVRPPDDELLEFLRREGALALRYSTPLDAPVGRVSYHVVCDDPDYGLHKLDGRARNAVRTGLKRCRVERVSLERVADEGWALEVDTCRRQGRDVPLSNQEWRRRYLSAAELPGFEAWGALVDGRLGAALLCVQIGDWCEVLAQQCLAEFLGARINNALTFVFTESTVRRSDVRSIFYTLQSLDAPASVDDFKFHMGYVARPVRQRVVFHPRAEHLVGPWSHRLVTAALRLRPKSHLLAKAEGMLRFRLQGERRAEDQEWPRCLQAPQREPARELGSRSSSV
ncbi:hypothetical protein [Anaeromyxobacter sp. Fw109-5]|uniref:hypothetical protein n=1 Tax=Anaeromyxobacter sp. (strain Fw109-5) TaxID=404589 RepID=UPI0000ED7F82|nr:hypothetical protein [Anaeromyxobacter sp. Fw109-5]ABS25440.1 conserved hypothetical cytosolic protein [Anaeromyxobacter sp. Fw109-5]